MYNDVHSGSRSRPAPILSAILLVTIGVLFGTSPLVYAKSSEEPPAASATLELALIILSTLDMSSFHEALTLVQARGGEVPLAFPPNAFVAILTPHAKWALSQHPTVRWMEREAVDPATFADVGGQAEEAAHVWNTVFQEIPDPNAAHLRRS